MRYDILYYMAGHKQILPPALPYITIFEEHSWPDTLVSDNGQ